MNIVVFQNSKIEVFYPYRKAVVSKIFMCVCEHTGVTCKETEDKDKVINMASDLLYYQIKRLIESNGYTLDNHITFKLKDVPIWYTYTDGSLRMGLDVLVY